MRKNIFYLLFGCLVGLPISLHAVNQQQQNRLPAYYGEELFQQASESIEIVKDATDSINHIEAEKTVSDSYEITEDELAEELYYDSLELLACCVEAEAGNQGLVGKKYVVDVILNRVDDEDFPDNITDVIMQKNQFSVVSDGRIWTVEPTEETFQAVTEELENRTNHDILYFTSEGFHACGTDWQKVGDHYFSTK